MTKLDPKNSINSLRASVQFAAEAGTPIDSRTELALDLASRLEVAEQQLEHLLKVLTAVTEYCGGTRSFRYPDVMRLIRQNGYPCTEAEYHEAEEVITQLLQDSDNLNEEDQEALERASDIVEQFEKVHFPV